MLETSCLKLLIQAWGHLSNPSVQVMGPAIPTSVCHQLPRPQVEASVAIRSTTKMFNSQVLVVLSMEEWASRTTTTAVTITWAVITKEVVSMRARSHLSIRCAPKRITIGLPCLVSRETKLSLNWYHMTMEEPLDNQCLNNNKCTLCKGSTKDLKQLLQGFRGLAMGIHNSLSRIKVADWIYSRRGVKDNHLTQETI